MPCPIFVTMIRDLTVRLLTEVCPNVETEPALHLLMGETLSLRTSNAEDGACLDVSAQGFWRDRMSVHFLM